jgi:radical SAM superfamily enzyme YgiQ (UPF0313 family)
MYKHALCIHPYRKDLKKFRFIPPIGLESIGRVVSKYAETLDIVDLRYENERTPDFIRPETGLVCFSINWQRRLNFVAAEIQSVPEGVLTIVGGRHATEDPEGWLVKCPNVDAVVRGDGEEAMEEICRGRPLDKIDGLSFRAGHRIVHNPVRKLGPIDNGLFPDRSRRRYTYRVEIQNVDTGLDFDLCSASRGCPYNCRFCSFNVNPWGEKRNWSGRSPESVVEELTQIQAPLVGFTDEIFTHDSERVERICDLILERGIKKKYIANARLEIARQPELIKKMTSAGFAMFLLGIESAQDKTLKSMRKGFNTRQIRSFFSVLRQWPIFLHGYFIIGNIGESLEEIEQVVPFARELGLDTVNLTLLRSSPHSGLGELVARNPGYHISPTGKVYSDRIPMAELKDLRLRLARKFYNRRQGLKILDKLRRTGLLSLFFSRGINSAASFFYSLRKAWVAGHRP